ncbi:helix-turn-helix domain-containing protein [Nocardia cyriacigeorgica]|uniref:helix-turn-helix domain-containing protein n=1 Tax=Nocardia cyriacigeorgica TaxID=135487 RepID=UPI0018946A5C|nr:helix-turn-helix domain-containing protein [Nocardia cyriacigeorgica]MBF6085118.1 helix-turn-helix domain-containing protein [Nocardia cyriacigeorgica]
MTLPRLHTPEEVAEQLRLDSTNWLEEAARRRRIPHVRIKRKLYFTEAQAAEIVVMHTVTPAAPPQRSLRVVQTPKASVPQLLQPRIPRRMQQSA